MDVSGLTVRRTGSLRFSSIPLDTPRPMPIDVLWEGVSPYLLIDHERETTDCTETEKLKTLKLPYKFCLKRNTHQSFVHSLFVSDLPFKIATVYLI
jgi:hypothetical protein